MSAITLHHVQEANVRLRALAQKAQESIAENKFIEPEQARLIKFAGFTGAAVAASAALAVAATAPVVAGAAVMLAGGLGLGGQITERISIGRARIRQDQMAVLAEASVFRRDLVEIYNQLMGKPAEVGTQYEPSSDLLQVQRERLAQQADLQAGQSQHQGQIQAVEQVASYEFTPSRGPRA